MAEYVSAKAECPFYISETEQYITCESALSVKGSAKHWFQSKKEKERYVNENCCQNRGEGCVYYCCIMKRYKK